jgi:hypothetical protein
LPLERSEAISTLPGRDCFARFDGRAMGQFDRNALEQYELASFVADGPGLHVITFSNMQHTKA